MGRGGGSASVTLAEDGGGAAAAPLPGKKRARCGSAPAASWEETCALPTNTNTQPRPGSSVPSPPSELQLFLALRLPARRRRRSPPAAPRPQRPGRPRWRGTSSRLLPVPLRLPGWAFPLTPSAFAEPRVLAYASVLSGSLSARQHELQRRLPPADQHAGPHDPL